jgi:hypothetical protein
VTTLSLLTEGGALDPQGTCTAFLGLPWRWKLLGLATAVVVVEVVFRGLAPKSRAYRPNPLGVDRAARHQF